MANPTAPFKPKRGRPSFEQVAAIERAILSTAREMFLEKGYDVVSMEGLASGVGISKGTLYARYKTKEKLFEAVIAQSVGQWSAEAERGNSLHGQDLESRLRYHAKTIARSQLQPDVRAFRKLALETRDRFPGLFQALHDIGYLYIVEIIVAEIEAAARQDGIPVRDAGSVARLLVNAIAGGDIQDPCDSPELAEDRASRIADLLLAARACW